MKGNLGTTPPDVLIIYNLVTSLTTTVDKSHGNASESTVERFIKPRESEIFGHPEYSLDDTDHSILLSVPQMEFFNSAFGI